MKTATTTIAPLALLALLGCQPGPVGAATENPAPAGDVPAAETRVVDRLPLRPGYYVAADTPCGEASNATLSVLREDGSGFGGFTTPPYFCEFKRIEQTGPSSFRATKICGNAHGGGDGDSGEVGTNYEILDDTSYRAKNDDGWESSARRCPRGELPSLWRDGAGPGDFVD